MAGGKLLILGGIRSGKSEYAESLLDTASQVRYVATAGHDDPSFAQRLEAHRFRRPASWETIETGADPLALFEVLGKADSQSPLLIDDLGAWATGVLGRDDSKSLVAQLADAVRDCPAQVILVSPEVGLSVVPATAIGAEFADLVGELNQAIAAACDEVALIVAGQPTWLKKAASAPPRVVPVAATPAQPAVTPVAAAVAVTPVIQPPIKTPPVASPLEPPPLEPPPLEPPPLEPPPLESPPLESAEPLFTPPLESAPPAEPVVSDDLADLRDDPRDDLRDAPLTEDVLHEQTRALPIVVTGLTIRPGMDLPIHDDEARAAAEAHLSNLEIPGSGLGLLSRIVVFAAGTQSRGVPTPWAQPHMLLLHGSHEGDVAAGDDVAESAQIAAATQRGEGSLGMLAAEQGVNVKVIDTPAAGDIAYGRAAAPEVVDSMLKEGWRLVDEAVDSGADLIIVGSCGSGADATAATVVSKVTGAEIAGLLGRVVGPDGTVDDSAWMLRCAAARDALHRTRNSDLNADTLLAELGGPDLALIAGVIVGATARRTPVMLDGPVGTAAALLARDLGSQSRLWSTLPDHGGHPTTKAAADVLGLTPLLDLKAGLGEGSVSLLALPLLRSALRLAATLPTRPTPMAAPPGFEDEREPLVD